MQAITFAPLPKVAHLLGACFNRANPDHILASPWQRSGERAQWFAKSSQSIAVIARWRMQISGKTQIRAWIPTYFCNDALRYLRGLGIDLVFYPVTLEMQPDFAACEQLLLDNAMDIFITVHYFGLAMPTDRMASLCRRHGSWLIEDAVHVFRPIPDVGIAGDFVLYSPHKHYAIPDGAIMIIREDGPGRLGNLQKLASLDVDVPFARQGALMLNLTVVGWVGKRLIQVLGFRGRKSYDDSFHERNHSSHANLKWQSMSNFSKRLLTVMNINLAGDIDCSRLERARNWQQIFLWISSQMALRPLQYSSTPYLAGFTAESEIDAATIFDGMRRAQLPVTTWPSLPPEALRSKGLFASALKLRDSNLFLPVHQSVEIRDMRASGARIQGTLISKWRMKEVQLAEWTLHWKCSKGNLLQSWEYGTAKEEAEGWLARRFVICNELGGAVALVQVLVRELPVLGGIARVNRGPISIAEDADGGLAVRLAAVGVLIREARKHRWWVVQIAPEIPAEDSAILYLQAIGLRKVSATAWGSALIDLRVSEQELLMKTDGKWRNCYRKGIKSGVIVACRRCEGSDLNYLLKSYKELKDSKGFGGLAGDLVHALAKRSGESWSFNMFVAYETANQTREDPIGTVVTIRTGNTVIYLIGFTNSKGRAYQANSVLLWEAMCHAKRDGCTWFDVGGLSEATPRGIAEFKRGLNGKAYQLVGEWRQFLPGW